MAERETEKQIIATKPMWFRLFYKAGAVRSHRDCFYFRALHPLSWFVLSAAVISWLYDTIIFIGVFCITLVAGAIIIATSPIWFPVLIFGDLISKLSSYLKTMFVWW